MVAFSIFWFSIYRYGIFYAIAFLLGYLWLAWLGKQAFIAPYPRVKKILTDNLEDLILVIALWVILWGRGGHILIYGNGYYFTHLSEIFKVREGGMSFIWGIIGVVIAIAIFSRFQKLKQSDFLLLFDMILIFVPLWILLWRCGNFLNQELYGIPISELPRRLAQLFQNLGLTHIYTKIDTLPRVNTNFLSMLLEWAMLFFIQLRSLKTYLKTKKIKIWILSTNFLLYYSIIRFLLEYLRADSQLEFIWFFTKSQWFFILFTLIAIVIKLFLRTQKEKKSELNLLFSLYSQNVWNHAKIPSCSRKKQYYRMASYKLWSLSTREEEIPTFSWASSTKCKGLISLPIWVKSLSNNV